MAVDFAADSQKVESASVVQHAMAMPGQSSSEAIAATQAYIQNNGTPLANRVHAGQDLVTPAHAGQEWVGFGWDLKTFNHIFDDLFPSTGTIANAYQSTRGILGGGGYK